MGTVLRVLVVFILILSIGASALAFLLFQRRELLINRTHMLEEQFIKVAKTLEAEPPPDQVQPRYVGKDISPVTSKELDNPERSAFWDTYQYKLETINLPGMDLDNEAKRLQLRQYYQMQRGPDGKLVYVKDALTQQPSTKGPGTMQELLDQIYARAIKQNETLNKTRAELAKLREELTTTIDEHNKLKTQGRADAKTIEEKQKKIEGLEEEIRGLKRKIDGLEEEKRALTAELAEAKNEITKQKATIDELSKTVTDQKKQIDDLLGRLRGGIIRDQTQAATQEILSKLTPGDHGKVVAADESLKFVVIELSDKFMTELLGPNRDQPLPQIDLMVRRPGMKSATGEFVTRIKLRQVIRPQNLLVADILIDWQQVPLAKNDVVFF
jgi:uncharacterized coiled-coil protein SlyX